MHDGILKDGMSKRERNTSDSAVVGPGHDQAHIMSPPKVQFS